jgi:hypothetical protein
MIEIGSHDYIFASLEEKVAWMQAGQGTDQTFQAGDGLKEIAVLMRQSDDNLGHLMRRTVGQAWQGRAASVAGDSLGRAAAAMTATAGSADHGGGSTHGYGDSFNQVKNAIGTTPPEAIGKESFLDWLGFTSDYRHRLTRYRAANKLATDALERHEANARQTLAGFQEAMQTAATPPGAGDQSSVPPGTGGVRQDQGRHPGQAAGTGQATGLAQAGLGSGQRGGIGGESTRSTGTGSAGTQSAATNSAGTDPSGTRSAGTGSVGVPPGGSAQVGRPPSPSGSAQVGTAGSSGVSGLPMPTYPGPRDRPSGDRPAGSGVGGPSGARPPGGWPGRQTQPLPGTGWPGEQQPPLAPRSGTGTPSEAARWSGGSGAAGRPGASGGTPPPMGMGMGGGAGGGERQHRNQNYVPSDEPFQIDPDDLVDEHGDAVAPPVIGMEVPNAAPRVEAWERW